MSPPSIAGLPIRAAIAPAIARGLRGEGRTFSRTDLRSR
jgi:hypothetical protein